MDANIGSISSLRFRSSALCLLDDGDVEVIDSLEMAGESENSNTSMNHYSKRENNLKF